MKKEFRLFVFIAVIMAFLMPGTVTGQAGKTNFTGDWVLNIEKSDKSLAPATKFSVKQDDSTLVQTMAYKGDGPGMKTVYNKK